MHAAEVSLLAGVTESADTEGNTYGWQVDVRYDLESPFSLSAAWINEGHLRDHRRDGLAALAWGRALLPNSRVSLAFGAGAYRYFDTRTGPGGGHVNVHGWAPVYTLSASYSTHTPWFLRLSLNHVHPAGDIDTNTLLLGLGYRLPEDRPERPSETAFETGEHPSEKTGTEVTLFLGDTVHNSLESRQGIAGGVEYRRGVSGHIDFTLSWIGEDNREEILRTGFGSQVWLVDDFLNRRIALGVGAGLYTFLDGNPPQGSDSQLDFAGLVTLTAGYRFAGRWICRFYWNRVMSDNDRDSDIFVLGAGFRWKD